MNRHRMNVEFRAIASWTVVEPYSNLVTEERS